MIPLRASAGHRPAVREVARLLQPSSYLEIGVREGDTLLPVVEESSALRRLVLCDTWDRASGGTGRGSHDHIADLLEKAGYRGSVRYLDGRSQETLPAEIAASSEARFKQAVDPLGRFDLTHVDGDHTYMGALQDLRNAWSLTDRAMIVHDVTFDAVWRAVATFARGAVDAYAHVGFGDWGVAVFERAHEALAGEGS